VATLAALASLALSAGAAQAQTVDPRLYEPSLGTTGVLGVDTSLVPGHLQLWGGLFASFANDELVTRTTDDTIDHGPLRNRGTATLAVGLGLFDRFELSLGAPLQIVEGFGTGGSRETNVSFGDLRVVARGRIFGADPGAAGFGLALAVDLTIPTSGGSTIFAGEDGLNLTPRLAVDWRSAAGAVVAFNVGYRMRTSQVVVDDLAVGDELRFGLGADLPVGAYDISLLGEVQASLGFGTDAIDPDGAATARKTPIEALAGVRWRPGDFTVTAAAGAGLTSGYGAPDYRVVFNLTYGGPTPPKWEEARVPRPADDPTAQPSYAYAPIPKLNDARFDAMAAADPDRDGDAVPSSTDRCLTEPEDRDGHFDGDGCPDLDDDDDGVPDTADKCPDEKEVYNGVDDDDGCPDEGGVDTSGIQAVSGLLTISETIAFVSGSAELSPKSLGVVDKVATFLLQHPEVKRVRIEGHTDDQGDKEQNVDLSERRAWSVKGYLVEHGVDGRRLYPMGYGPTRPVDPRRNKAARAKNRRVEFHVIANDQNPDGTLRDDGGSKIKPGAPVGPGGVVPNTPKAEPVTTEPTEGQEDGE
jgi:outer membrane protein OmpA-like peptidoglycan-associated protein